PTSVAAQEPTYVLPSGELPLPTVISPLAQDSGLCTQLQSMGTVVPVMLSAGPDPAGSTPDDPVVRLAGAGGHGGKPMLAALTASGIATRAATAPAARRCRRRRWRARARAASDPGGRICGVAARSSVARA